MPLQAIRQVAKPQNGVGAFILQCKSLHFTYCDWAGSSKGMNSFLTHYLPRFAQQNPQIEITVSPKPRKHPVIKGNYINGREKAVCVANMDPKEIVKKAVLLRDASGEKLKKVTKPVKSLNESVRGIWDPFHGHQWKI
ncbi:39S ribosomal protein L51, mitochondrial [Zalaria obscura]|uniref:39S ribosomal protein L51, mitochondrial n=1 Tax=Zalaria obscura TaxID=2024903 RepID=A0ACC3SN57_9PEZI